jgi:hypothetical protein
VPGKPQNVSAAAGNALVRLSWRKAADNGAPITRYVVTGGGQTVAVGANQRTAVVRNLVNGQSYTFAIYAVNAIGNGPSAVTAPVIPQADVPAAPISVTAVAKPDGTVVVTWPAANGLGRAIIRYTVTAVSGGTQAPVGDVTTTSMTVPAGALPYGTQVAFTVVAVNDRNAGSDPSPVSNTVVPYTVPGAPGAVLAQPDPSQRGAVAVSWQPAPSNGRPITGYVVTAGTTSQTVATTSAVLGGYADDTAVTVKVHALNAAGAGPDVTATGRTIGLPTITVTGVTSGYNSISVTLTPNNKGGAASCQVQVAGAGTASVGCTTAPVTVTVPGLWPNRAYTFTASVNTPAGSATSGGSQPTLQLHASVICGVASYCGSGIFIYSVANNGNPSNAVGKFTGGTTFTPNCHIAGDNVDASPWGGHTSTEWLGLTYQGKPAYFPFAWTNTDGGNNTNLLPGC